MRGPGPQLLCPPQVPCSKAALQPLALTPSPVQPPPLPRVPVYGAGSFLTDSLEPKHPSPHWFGISFGTCSKQASQMTQCPCLPGAACGPASYSAVSLSAGGSVIGWLLIPQLAPVGRWVHWASLGTSVGQWAGQTGSLW